MASFFDLKARKAEAAAAAASSTTKPGPSTKDESTRLQPWVEKYRPRTLTDITAQDHTTQILQRLLHTSNLPHMLFYGPPGTGKTSTILALAHQLFGPQLTRSRVLELNASDERGIGIVRDKVKRFARQQLSNPPAGAAGLEYRARHPCPPFKIVVLDEADSMTQDAQAALRRTMEAYSRITRFCLVCNYVTRIIDPLASRCSKFRFKSLDAGNAAARLEHIAAREGVRLGEGAVEALVRCSEGDLRKAITFLQSAARLVGALGTRMPDPEADMEVDGDEAGVVTVKVVEEIAGVVPDATVDGLLQTMRPRKAAGVVYEAVAKQVADLVADGWSAAQLVGQLYERLLFDERIPNVHKNQIVLVFSETDKRLVDGADEHLAVLDLALRVSRILGAR